MILINLSGEVKLGPSTIEHRYHSDNPRAAIGWIRGVYSKYETAVKLYITVSEMPKYGSGTIIAEMETIYSKNSNHAVEWINSESWIIPIEEE